ncbi:MAG: hypothetical protein ACSHYA_00195 [Opitutaceae bacterium]
MNTLLDLKEIDKNCLLNGLDRTKRRSIESIMRDGDVHYVVLLESADKRRRNLLTVGPDLEYPTLDAVRNVEMDNLVPSAYVDNRNVKTRGSFLKSKASIENRRLERLVEQLQSENRDLKSKRFEAVSKLEILERSEQNVNRLLIENRQMKMDLDQREREVHRMEEELMDHMNQLVHKQTEMEQWEENMFARERAFAEKQEKLIEVSEKKGSA